MIYDHGNVICCNINKGFRGVANSGCFSNNWMLEHKLKGGNEEKECAWICLQMVDNHLLQAKCD